MKYLLGSICLFLSACSKPNLFENFGSTMSPTIEDGEIIEASPIEGSIDAIRRHDVVVFLDPTTSERSYFVMRVWGLPGELIEIKEGKVLANKKQIGIPQKISLNEVSNSGKITTIKLGSREFFVMGDNIGNSWDSRFWGALPGENIIGIWEEERE